MKPRACTWVFVVCLFGRVAAQRQQPAASSDR
jgi:hypothetical protein